MDAEGRRNGASAAPGPPAAAYSALSTLLEALARGPETRLGSYWDAVLRPGVVVDRFEMVRELGRGGFGVVWEARDTRLGRSVAFKALRVQLRDGFDEKRVLREADVAARLAHPNIVTLHDAGRTDDGPYLVLELLRGESLAARLDRGPLPTLTALHVAREIAKGLACAHAQGVVHRDLQPGNVFLCEQGGVKILDFGLAYAFGAARIGGGTPRYMAPEQWRGAPEDERTDIFALGVMLYRMLSGAVPFADDRGQAVTSATPAPPLRIDALPGLAALVARMLEKDPVARPRDGAAVLEELSVLAREAERVAPAVVSAKRPATARRWVVFRNRAEITTALVAAIVTALLTLVVVPRLQRTRDDRGRAATPAPQRVLAVLPFRASEGIEESLAAGLTETLTNKLQELDDVRTAVAIVAATELAREKVASAREARTAFGASLALSGTVKLDGDSVEVTTTLVNATTGVTTAARTIRTRRGDLAGLNRQLIPAVAELLELHLGPAAERRLAGDPSPAPGAYEFYLQGRGYLQRYDRIENLDSALVVFDAALKRDPGYALAHAGKAEAHLRRYAVTSDPTALEAARTSAQRAVELGSRLAPVQLTMGLVAMASSDYLEAIRRFETVLELEPQSSDAHRELGYAYDRAGRIAEAEETFKRAIRLRPSSWAAYNYLAAFYHVHGRLTEALPLFQRVLDLTPDNYQAYANLGGIYSLLGLHDEAVLALERSLQLRPTSHAYANLGTVQFFRGRFGAAADAFGKAVALSPTDSRLLGDLADAERWGGRAEEAARHYRHAIELLQQELAKAPRDAEVGSRMAIHLSALGQHEPALSQIAKALAVAPGDPLVLFRAALVHEQAGLRDRAIESVRAAIAAGYSRNEVRNAPELEQLRLDRRFDAVVATPATPRATQRKE